MTPLVLVVDDDDAIRETFALALTDAGYRVATASRGDAVVATAKAQGADVIVLDVLLPGQDGLSVLVDLGRLLPKVPVLVTSAQPMAQPVGHLQASPLPSPRRVVYLQKPLDLDTLLGAVAHALEHAKPDVPPPENAL